MDNEIKVKEVAFNKISQWISEFGFIIQNQTVDKKPEASRQFELQVVFGRGHPYPFRIIFSKMFKGSFTISSNMSLNKEDAKSLKGMKNKDFQQIFMDIRKLVYSLRVNVEVRYPQIFLFKEITIDAISNNKQFLIDELYNFRNTMELVEIRIDELYYHLVLSKLSTKNMDMSRSFVLTSLAYKTGYGFN
jgi:hypothetical protein